MSEDSIGYRIRSAREAREWSLDRLARAVCAVEGRDGVVKRQEVHRWEKGGRTPGYWVPFLENALGLTPGALTSPAGPGSRVEATGIGSGKWDRRGADTLVAMLDDERPVTDQAARDLAHAWLIEDPPQIVQQSAGRRVGVALIGEMRERTNRLRRMDDVVGSGDLLGTVVRELRATLGVLREAAYTGGVGERLLGLAAEQAQLVGWVAADMGMDGFATRAYLLGLSAARAAGDAGLGSLCLGGLGYLRASSGRVEESAVLTRSAAAGVRSVGSPRELALVWDRVAWAAAVAGREPEAEAALGRASDAHDAYTPGAVAEPDWLYWVSHAESQIMRGRVWTELHRPLRAVPVLSRVIADYDSGHAREAALYRSWLAAALLDANEIEAAASETARVIRDSSGVTSARIGARVGLLLRRLRPFGSVSAVREILDSAATV